MARYDPATNNTYYTLQDRLYALGSIPVLCWLASLVDRLGHHPWTWLAQTAIGFDVLHAAWIVVVGQENHDPD